MKKVQPLIKAATIATALDKETGAILGFAVRSNEKGSTKFYQITYTRTANGVTFVCSCEAKEWGCLECCHIKAIKEVLVAISEREEEQAAVAEAEKIVARMQPDRFSCDGPVNFESPVGPVDPRQMEALRVASVAAAVGEIEDAKLHPSIPLNERGSLNRNAGFQLLAPSPAARAAQAVKERVYNAPTPRRVQEDW